MSIVFDNSNVVFASAADIVRTLQSHGHSAYFVGGSVRDTLRGNIAHDIDIATSAHPDDVVNIFPSKLVGAKFGVVIVKHNDIAFEVATFRKDGVYTDGRRPDTVSFSTSIEDDSGRRDFTMNAIFYDPVSDSIHDFHGGVDDVRNGVVKTVGNPNDRFQEDHLRMLRAVRFASTFGFSMDDSTMNAIVGNASSIVNVSQERITNEIFRMFTEGDPDVALLNLKDTGLLQYVLPEVYDMIGVDQPIDHHPEGDVFNHTLKVLHYIKRVPELIFAAILHDVGKPSTFSIDAGRIRFTHHDKVGAEIARNMLARMRFPNSFVDHVVHLVETHMLFLQAKNLKQSKLRAVIGDTMFEDRIELHRADSMGSNGDLSNYNYLVDMQLEFRNRNEDILPDPLINGHDVVSMGLSPGPVIKIVLDRVRDAQLSGSVSSRDEALSMMVSIVDEINSDERKDMA